MTHLYIHHPSYYCNPKHRKTRKKLTQAAPNTHKAT
jgi:hypothetical protein